MPALPRPAAVLAALACAACQTAGSGADAARESIDVHYRHVRTCTDFLGNPGQFFAYEVTRIDNGTAAPFDFAPGRLRFSDGAAPVLVVPEFSDLRAEPASREESTEVYLLHRGSPGPPPRGAVPLAYDAAEVRMVRGAGEPEYDEASGCADFST